MGANDVVIAVAEGIHSTVVSRCVEQAGDEQPILEVEVENTPLRLELSNPKAGGGKHIKQIHKRLEFSPRSTWPCRAPSKDEAWLL
jgi:hypothetical protein